MNIGSLNWIQTGTEHAETVVFLHAVGYDLTYWDRQIEMLCDAYNCVAPDLPGHGRSPAKPEDWTFEAASQLISELIDSGSGKPVHLIGISFGSMLALATVLVRPDLVRSLTLIGSAPTFPTSVRAGMLARASTVREHGMEAVLDSSLDRWFSPAFRARRPDLIDRVTKTVSGADPFVHAAIWELVATLELRDRLPAIQCPTLVVVGSLDPSTPPSVAADLAHWIRGAKLVEIPEAFHIVTVEAPEAVNGELLSFLQKVDVFSKSDLI